ncbi:MAG: type II toxin-antitoxin system HicA family toxin [Muribaculaceae bacterium]|nr:type II toxin-antitoxin system HicA family toxin [Muribaculaceae bacterium]
MSTTKLKNIDIATFESFLKEMGCRKVKSGNDGHFKWKRQGCLRSIIFQTHIEPIPEHIIENNLRNLGITKKQFKDWLLSRKKK